MLLGKDEKAVLITRALINVTETSIVTNRLQRRRIHPLVIPGQEAQARLRQVTTYGVPPFERRRHGQDTIREGKMEIMHGNRIGIVKQRIGYEEIGVEGIVPCSNRGGFKRALTIALEVVLRRGKSQFVHAIVQKKRIARVGRKTAGEEGHILSGDAGVRVDRWLGAQRRGSVTGRKSVGRENSVSAALRAGRYVLGRERIKGSETAHRNGNRATIGVEGHRVRVRKLDFG